MARAKKTGSKAEQTLREFALSYPETHEEFPWDHRAMKVRKKVFVFLGTNDTGFFASMKLPESHPMALEFPFTSPTGYGLGKHGWVSAQFGPKDKIPLDLLKDWIDESYRAVAPKKLIALLPEP